MGEHKLIMGKDIYFWNFIILMFFTLFEVGAVFFEEYPGTDIRVSMYVVWGIGLSNPEGVNGLPGWCTPDWGEQYATER